MALDRPADLWPDPYMLMVALLIGLQNVEFERRLFDEKARAEILDYRGRLDYCAHYIDAGPPDWRCPQLKVDAERLKARFKDRPDLLALMNKDSSEHEKSGIISTGYNSSPIVTLRVEHVGIDDKNRRFVVAASSDESSLKEVTVRLPGSKQEVVLTPQESIPSADLQTIQLRSMGAYTFIEMKFGSQRPWCFQNIDAQPEVTFTLKGTSELEVARTDYEGCQQNSRLIPSRLTLRPSK